MEKNNERRRYNRIKSEFNIKIDQVSKKETIFEIETGNSVNVSASGILFQYNKKLDPGEKLTVKFLKPNSFDFFSAEAKVVRAIKNPRSDSYEVAIDFTNLNPKEMQKLEYYLKGEIIA